MPSDNLVNYVAAVEGIDRSSFKDDGERSEALRVAYALVARLESPWETVARIVMTEPALGASLKVVRDLRLFEIWHDHDDEPRTSEDLAKLVPCDSFLLHRILRHLAANNLLEEPLPGTYKQTSCTFALIQPVFGAWITYLYDATIPCFHKMPEYLAKTGYMNPSDPKNGVFQYTTGSEGTLFDYYKTHPRESETFNNLIGGVMARQASMLDIYPYEVLVDLGPKNKVSEEFPLLVDVGGNVGHDLEKFRIRHPEQASRLILQDRPDVICNAICLPPVQIMAYDFFTQQYVKGARAYYFHGVFHDWSDEPALQILENLKGAMTPGYSKLLIHDHVIPEQHPHPQATGYDLTMMVKVSAFERGESMWYTLLEKAGFKVIKIWHSALATQSVIEAELASCCLV